MRFSACFLLVAAAALASCGGGGSAAPASSAPASAAAKPSTAPAASAAAPASASAAAPASAAPASAAAKPSAAASASPAPAQSGAGGATKVTIAYGTNSGETTPMWVAVDEGLFKKYGLDVNATYASGSLAADSLVSGSSQASFMGGADAMTLISTGTPLKIVSVLIQENPYAIVVRPEIKQASDLKGKSLAIGKLGDTSDISAHMALSSLGIDPSKDLTERQIGNSPARFAALASGQVAGAIEDQAYTAMLVKQGMHVLVSLADQKVPYIANGLVVTAKYAQEQPKIVEAMVHGVYDGVQFTLDPKNKQQVLQVMAKYTRADPNSADLANVYKSMEESVAKDPTPNVAGEETILKAMQAIDPNRYGKYTAADAIDSSFMEKVKASASPSAAAS